MKKQNKWFFFFLFVLSLVPVFLGIIYLWDFIYTFFLNCQGEFYGEESCNFWGYADGTIPLIINLIFLTFYPVVISVSLFRRFLTLHKGKQV